MYTTLISFPRTLILKNVVKDDGRTNTRLEDRIVGNEMQSFKYKLRGNDLSVQTLNHLRKKETPYYRPFCRRSDDYPNASIEKIVRLSSYLKQESLFLILDKRCHDVSLGCRHFGVRANDEISFSV